MNAAVVSAFENPPRYEEFPTPSPTDDDEMLVEVVAAGLHPRVRSQAGGSHYTSTGELPLVPGIDGVGRDADGALRYFVLPDTTMGSMAEHTVIDRRRSVILQEHADAVSIAAAMNPAMSSWVALRRRVQFEPGQGVLVLGATGNAGRMAVQVARRLDAGSIVAAGRDTEKLEALAELGATDTVELRADQLAGAAAEVDVVLDYVWGEATASAMAAIVTARSDRGRPLTWIEIGSVAGPTAAIPSAALRAAQLQIVGSGQGSVSTRDILAELPALAEEITRGTFTVDALEMPLSAVEQAWEQAATTARRIVLVP
jgi:NADPH:quinone reductase-like Zn-dependent oxidoreductase